MNDYVNAKTVLRDAAVFIKDFGLYIFGLGKRLYAKIKSAAENKAPDSSAGQDGDARYQ